MASASERTASHRRAPTAAISMDSLDGLPGVGLDTNDDLMDQLIAEAGSVDEQDIIETGLPEDYDPSGGMGEMGGGQVARVFKMDGSSPTNEAGNTRVGLLPKFSRTPLDVAPKLAAPRSRPQPEPEPEEESAFGDTEEAEDEDPPEALADDLPEDPVAMGPVYGLAEPEAIDLGLMAELSGGVREVHAAPRLEPTASEPPVEPLPAEPAPVARPFLTKVDIPASPCWMQMQIPVAPVSRQAQAVLEFTAPSVAPWVCRLDDMASNGFWPLLACLTEDIRSGSGGLLPIHGTSRRAAAMRPVLDALLNKRKVSTAHHLHYREEGEPVFLYVSTLLYSSGERTGLLLVEATSLAQGNQVAVRRLSLFDPSLLLG